MKTINDIDLENVPRHVAIIMDGNGRWAQRQDKIRLFGHQSAIQAVRDAVEAAARLQVGYITLYTFSTENWNRPKDEVDGLMHLMIKAVEEETPTLMKNNVRLITIGDLDRLPQASRQSMQQCINATASNTGTTLVLALSYSARWEMAVALKKVVADAAAGRLKAEDVNEETMRNYLVTRDIPDPDLSSVPVANSGSATSCSGSWPTRSSASWISFGPTSVRAISTRRSSTTSIGNVASAKQDNRSKRNNDIASTNSRIKKNLDLNNIIQTLELLFAKD